MGQQQPKEYYDRLWSSPYYQRSAAEMDKWCPVWEAVAFYLQDSMKAGAHIVDLGCGPGHLAELLKDCQDMFIYTGYDFSPVAILAAQQRVDDGRFCFKVADLQTHDFVTESGVYVATEFLEHVKFDLELISRIPAGSRFLFSVPTFDDPSHVRTYKDPFAIRSRYWDLLDIPDIFVMPDGYRFVVQAIRRTT